MYLCVYMSLKNNVKRYTKRLLKEYTANFVREPACSMPQQVKSFHYNLSKISHRYVGRARWLKPVIPTLLEAEAGGSPATGSLRPALATW